MSNMWKVQKSGKLTMQKSPLSHHSPVNHHHNSGICFQFCFSSMCVCVGWGWGKKWKRDHIASTPFKNC